MNNTRLRLRRPISAQSEQDNRERNDVNDVHRDRNEHLQQLGPISSTQLTGASYANTAATQADHITQSASSIAEGASQIAGPLAVPVQLQGSRTSLQHASDDFATGRLASGVTNAIAGIAHGTAAALHAGAVFTGGTSSAVGSVVGMTGAAIDNLATPGGRQRFKNKMFDFFDSLQNLTVPRRVEELTQERSRLENELTNIRSRLENELTNINRDAYIDRYTRVAIELGQVDLEIRNIQEHRYGVNQHAE